MKHRMSNVQWHKMNDERHLSLTHEQQVEAFLKRAAPNLAKKYFRDKIIVASRSGSRRINNPNRVIP